MFSGIAGILIVAGVILWAMRRWFGCGMLYVPKHRSAIVANRVTLNPRELAAGFNWVWPWEYLVGSNLPMTGGEFIPRAMAVCPDMRIYVCASTADEQRVAIRVKLWFAVKPGVANLGEKVMAAAAYHTRGFRDTITNDITGFLAEKVAATKRQDLPAVFAKLVGSTDLIDIQTYGFTTEQQRDSTTTVD